MTKIRNAVHIWNAERHRRSCARVRLLIHDPCGLAARRNTVNLTPDLGECHAAVAFSFTNDRACHWCRLRWSSLLVRCAEVRRLRRDEMAHVGALARHGRCGAQVLERQRVVRKSGRLQAPYATNNSLFYRYSAREVMSAEGVPEVPASRARASSSSELRDAVRGRRTWQIHVCYSRHVS